MIYKIRGVKLNEYLEVNIKEEEITKIKKCNEFTNKYGLILNDRQIYNLIEKKKEALKDMGRIEFRGGVIDRLIKEFCDSPYINQENYESTLYELIDIFYEYKNETMDLVTDDELIKFMRTAFDEICKGDTQYLAGTIMYQMRKQIIEGKSIEDIKVGEDIE